MALLLRPRPNPVLMQPANIIDGLEIKLRQLAAKSDRQRADYAALVEQNEKLKRELDRQLGVVSALKDKLERNQVEPATIEFCLQEIDRCIDWLQRN